MTSRSKSTLFLIEQLIVIAVFAICAAACISILTAAFFKANDTRATSQAIHKAESAAEVFKATGGDVETVANILGGFNGTDISGNLFVTVFYDTMWKLSDYTQRSFVLHIVYEQADRNSMVTVAELTVERVTGEELVAFQLAAR